LASDRIPWHNGFAPAVKAELLSHKDKLEFNEEYQLNVEPYKIDLLVIKKPRDVYIDKNIARVFRVHNILEYKSPDDSFTVDDFKKVNIYACAYSLKEGVHFDDMTISLVVTKHPREFIKFINAESGAEMKEIPDGIRQTVWMGMPLQIIETKKLSPSENLWLSSLGRDNETGRITALLNETSKLGDSFLTQMGAYFNIVFNANKGAYEEVRSIVAHQSTLDRLFVDLGYKDKALHESIVNFLQLGVSVENVVKATKLPVEVVQEIDAQRVAGKLQPSV